MRVFVTGTDTDVGKTTVCSWLCLHTDHSYFKPIQTGNTVSEDRSAVSALATNVKTYTETYSFTQPFSPHLAARLDNDHIDVERIVLPQDENVIVEGAGGLMVPLNEEELIIDLIERLRLPVILVARTTLGTLNHTLLSLEALRQRDIEVLGVILNGESNDENKEAIEFYGNVRVLQTIPKMKNVSTDALKQIELGEELKIIFN